MNVSLDLLLEDITDEEEIDSFFNKLEQFEPPADMVERIMSAVSQFPLPQVQRTAPWSDLELQAVK